MRIAIIGSRTIDHNDKNVYSLFGKVIQKYVGWKNVKSISTGDAAGADSVAVKLWSNALQKNIKYEFHYFPALWDENGKSAGHQRNKFIEENADICFAFVDKNINQSKGTLNCVSLFDKNEKKVYIINVKTMKIEKRNYSNNKIQSINP